MPRHSMMLQRHCSPGDGPSWEHDQAMGRDNRVDRRSAIGLSAAAGLAVALRACSQTFGKVRVGSQPFSASPAYWADEDRDL